MSSAFHINIVDDNQKLRCFNAIILMNRDSNLSYSYVYVTLDLSIISGVDNATRSLATIPRIVIVYLYMGVNGPTHTINLRMCKARITAGQPQLFHC